MQPSKIRAGNPIHPGEMLLKDFLKPSGISQRELARRLNWPQGKVNKLVGGKLGINAETALDLAEELKTSPEVWMNLQSTWDLHKAILERKAT